MNINIQSVQKSPSRKIISEIFNKTREIAFQIKLKTVCFCMYYFVSLQFERVPVLNIYFSCTWIRQMLLLLCHKESSRLSNISVVFCTRFNCLSCTTNVFLFVTAPDKRHLEFIFKHKDFFFQRAPKWVRSAVWSVQRARES